MSRRPGRENSRRGRKSETESVSLVENESLFSSITLEGGERGRSRSLDGHERRRGRKRGYSTFGRTIPVKTPPWVREVGRVLGIRLIVEKGYVGREDGAS